MCLTGYERVAMIIFLTAIVIQHTSLRGYRIAVLLLGADGASFRLIDS